MRWAVVILGAFVAGAAMWFGTALVYQQSAEVSATVATATAAIVVAAAAKWANGDSHPATPAPVSEGRPMPPADPRQLVVGDPPGEAVCWLDRVDLLDRLTVMSSGGQTVVVCAVTGQRGIGKTQLAAAYARERIRGGWPVVVWVVADTETNLVNGLDALAAAAGVRQPDTDSVDAARAALAWLCRHPGPCLLVYDNALDPDLISTWRPTFGAVHTVVTTTRHDFANVGKPLDVGLFTPQEALTDLSSRTGLRDSGDAAQLATELGRLPLALAAAGAVIGPGRRYPSYRAYLDRLRTVPVQELLPRPTGDPYPHGAAEAILLALDDLTESDPTGHARALIDRLAVLAPTGVDPILLAHLADDDGSLSVLSERSLVVPSTDNDRTVLHRLLQRVIRDHRMHRGDLDPLLVDTADRLRAAAEQVGDKWATRTLIAEYARHTETLTSHTANEATQKELLHLRQWILYWLLEVHNHSAAVAFAEALVVDMQRILGPDHPDTLGSLDNLAIGYRGAGHIEEATALHERTLADLERVLGPDHADTLRSRYNLANCHRDAGRFDHAIELNERTLAGHEGTLGPDHPNTLESRRALASSYKSAGRYDEAVALNKRTVADCERIFGPDHPQTLKSRHNLANGYIELRRYDEAITLHERTLADYERIVGPDHPETLQSRYNLAIAYEWADRPDEALALHERTLADRERIFGPDHPDSLRARRAVADLRARRRPGA